MIRKLVLIFLLCTTLKCPAMTSECLNALGTVRMVKSVNIGSTCCERKVLKVYFSGEMIKYVEDVSPTPAQPLGHHSDTNPNLQINEQPKIDLHNDATLGKQTIHALALNIEFKTADGSPIFKGQTEAQSVLSFICREID